MKKVLIIDDETKLRGLLARIISLEEFEVIEAGNGKEAFKRLEQNEVDVVLCDVKLPDINGIDLAKEIKTRYPIIEIILLTAFGNIPDSVIAIKNGAFNYITKGDDNNKIIPLLNSAIEKVELSKRIRQLEKQLGARYSFDNLIGNSKAIRFSIDLAKKVASTETTVLLTGETGTGKEIFAQAIHHASYRNNRPFVAINCSAFGKDLLESEMFGHIAGSFTGAIKDTKGLFEEADSGTIFLDEIGDMNIELQAKLLRVLESHEFFKVGESKSTKVNIRIIAASNRDLLKEIESGHFRNDLYYRLSVFLVHLPALKERVNDIEDLAYHFAALFSAKTNKNITALSSEYIEVLKHHSWPGNIRELKNIIERSVILEEGNILTIESLPYEFLEPIQKDDNSSQLSAFSLNSAEKIHIQKVMNYTNSNKTETARLLNIALTTLYRKLDEYKIS